MTIQVDITHKNKGYDKKLLVIRENKHHETGEWVEVSSTTVEAGATVEVTVHTHSRTRIEEA